MAKFRLDQVAELARQMAFTPTEGRAAQVSAAEALLLDVDPAKAYPFDFIVYRITGYHPMHVRQDLLTGLALQHDLGVLVERVSDTLNVRVDQLHEPVLTIEDVSAKFNVTSKTVQRWRRRGLAARRFVFPDGKKRVGFLAAGVERFLSAHSDQVTRAANFSQVGDAERDEILRRARRLAGACQCCGGEIARRIGRKLNRSPITVAHVVRRHDLENPAEAVFPAAAAPVSDDERAQILRGFRRGVPLKSLARRTCRTRSAVYRVVVEERLARLNKRKFKFIDDPLYHLPDAAEALDAIAKAEDLMSERRADEGRIPRDLPPYLQALYRTPLLTPARERALFLKLNFHKFEFVTLRRRIEPEFVRARDLDLLEAHRRRAVDEKNRIIAANLRLVVSVARKHLRPGLSLMELISDGNLTLMRAVDSFDAHRGNRFSTYATLALMKGFARSVPEMLATGRGSGGDPALLANVADAHGPLAAARLAERDHVHQLLSALDPRERDVLRAHYGLAEDAPPATYEQVGRRLGLSKQRVRQIEQTAFAKLRASETRGL